MVPGKGPSSKGALGAGAGAMGGLGARGASGGRRVAQATSIPTMAAIAHRTCAQARPVVMTLLLLEALGALLIFVFIVWWTMFSGRKNGELPPEDEDEPKR